MKVKGIFMSFFLRKAAKTYIFHNLKDPDLLTNERTRGGGEAFQPTPPFISARSNVADFFRVLKKKHFSFRFFLALISNFLLNRYPWLIYKLFFSKTFWFEIFISIKSHVIWTNVDVFALFWPLWTFRQPTGSQV